MKFVMVAVVLALVFAPIAVFAGTLTVGDKVKLETGFGEAYAGNLESVSWSYRIYNQYLELDRDSLGAGDDVVEVIEGDVVSGVFTGTARDGVVSAPVFEAVGATLSWTVCARRRTFPK